MSPTPRLLGLDIGGTNTPFGVTDSSGNLLFRQSIPTGGDSNVQGLLERIFTTLKTEFGDKVTDQLQAVGVGAPNANPFTGWINSPPNISWGSFDLKTAFKDYTRAPLFLTNDANAAAYGEWRIGWKCQPRNLLVVTLGTGLGSGFIVEGALMQGVSGHAGELGHVRVEWPGHRCNCGLAGCLETRVSAKGVLRNLKDVLATGLGSELATEGITPRELHEAAEMGDVAAIRTFELTADFLARGLATAVHITSPERVLLCGGIARAGRWLLDPLNARLRTCVMSPFRDSCVVEASRLDPDDAGLLGAIEWAREGLASGTDHV